MSEFNSILVATDFSDISGSAFTKAVDLARQLNAQLHIVHIVQIHPANMPQSGNVNIEELEALEDDLNFYSFAGVASPRILSLMEGAVALN